jgi:site-specific DNA-methyltransferase (adenine-specific)
MSETKFTMEQADCATAMRKLKAKSVDVVVTSPPYNRGKKYDTYIDRMSDEEYLLWSILWTKEVHRVLKPHGSFFLNIGGWKENPFLPFEVLAQLRSRFVLQNTFHWIKSISVQLPENKIIVGKIAKGQRVAVQTGGGEVVTGIVQPGQKIKVNGVAEISVGRFAPLKTNLIVNNCHEFMFHLTKSGDTPLDRLAVGVVYAATSNIDRWEHTAGRDRRCRGNSWFIPYVNKRNENIRGHPATFPVELAANCIKIHGVRPGVVVLDPFVGIGSSAEAAKECGVAHFIGFDLSGSYLAEARKRVGLT